MAIQIRPSDEAGLVLARITRQMTLEDQHALETIARSAIDDGEDARLLVTLEAFEGWAKSDGWGEDVDFMVAYGDRIRRIAIVGDARWQDEALAFAGQGFRAGDVRYFVPDALDEANAWIRDRAPTDRR
jgi:hypothetical protein